MVREALKQNPPFDFPNNDGFFGAYGGRFVPTELEGPLSELATVYEQCKQDPSFQKELQHYLSAYGGRETPLFLCNKLTQHCGGAKIYLKREDLNHLGAHKINNAIGQVLVAKRMGKKRLIAETGAGQHGVATAAVAALMGMECVVYMGEEDIRRQQPNVFRMRLMGATVVPVTSGQRTLKEAVDAALEAYVEDPDSFYLLGSAVGPHPYPVMVRDFQSVIGYEARRQGLAYEGKLPDACVACVGGGSNAIGLFHAFIHDTDVKLVGVEAGGKGSQPGEHAAALTYGTPGVLHGYRSYVLQDEHGEAASVYSISAGLDYPGIGPEHAALKDSLRASYVTATDAEAIEAFTLLCRQEGIIPALESSHALAYGCRMAASMPSDAYIIICLSGRGDKDIAQLQNLL